MVRQP